MSKLSEQRLRIVWIVVGLVSLGLLAYMFWPSVRSPLESPVSRGLDSPIASVTPTPPRTPPLVTPRPTFTARPTVSFTPAPLVVCCRVYLPLVLRGSGQT